MRHQVSMIPYVYHISLCPDILRHSRLGVDYIVSYTRACETSAGCLRSIYLSLGLRELFGDVTMGQWRHN